MSRRQRSSPERFGRARQEPHTATKRPSPLGLSPRVRGSHQHWRDRPQRARSIPACAGEPPSAKSEPKVLKVYPRVCGGALKKTIDAVQKVGLSPRVRGSLTTRYPPPKPARSIPARAGEPRRRAPAPRRERVYPRACGGTMGDVSALKHDPGLSPRVRGNLVVAQQPTGPLPVYPRACGGTPLLVVVLGYPFGSIPARAGEPPRI